MCISVHTHVHMCILTYGSQQTTSGIIPQEPSTSSVFIFSCFLFFIFIFVFIYVCVYNMSVYPQGPEKDARSPGFYGVGVKGSCELTNMCAGN